MSTITLTVDTDDPSDLHLTNESLLGRMAVLWRALLADGFNADLNTEVDDPDEIPADPSSLN
jgi:hypothetical protein